ncbi:putative ribonuclease H-like domain-containing protein [Tanacetum coccineum]
MSTVKLPILKKGEYDIWAMKMEHYLAHTDYPIWEVIQKGNGPISIITDTQGVVKVLPPRTAEEILARERERKARTTLLMALPEDHLAKFHKITDAKEMWDAIKSRFGRNDKSKKMQNQLEIHGAGVSTEDANQKLLRSLPFSWSQVSLIMRTKPGIDDLSFDDFTNSTNEVSTANGASPSSSHNSKKEISSSYTDDLILKKFYKKTRRKLHFDAKEPVGFDKTKVECYNCHKTGHFVRECRLKGSQDAKRKDAGSYGYKVKDNGRRPGKNEEPNALVTLGGEGIDWTAHAEDEEPNFALMAFNNASSDTEFGLGYGDHIFNGILSYENEVLQSMFMNKDSNTDDRTLYDRFVTTDGTHAVPPPMTGNYMPSRPNIEIDESQFIYGPKQPQSSESETRTSDFDSCESNSTVETLDSLPVPIEIEPNIVSTPKVWTDAPIIEEYESYGDDDFSHLIRDYDFHEKKMAKQAEMNKKISKSTTQKENRPIWNNVQRENHLNQFVPSAVLTRSGKIPIHTVRASGTKNVNTARQIVSTARQNSNSQAVPTRTVRKVSTMSTKVNDLKPKTVFYTDHSPSKRPFTRTAALKAKSSKPKVNTARGNAVSAVGGIRKTAVKASAGCVWRPKRYYDNPQRALKNKGIVDSGSSKHMTRNKGYLVDYQEYNGGPVTFGGSKGQITSKGKIRTGKLDFDDLPDENQVLLRVPRQHNMYNFNLENFSPSEGLTCLIAKATTDESNKWHRRLGHVNFKNLNKLMKGNLVRGIPSKSSKVKDGDKKSHKDEVLNSKQKPVDMEELAFLEELKRLKSQEKETNNAAEALRKELDKSTDDLLQQAGFDKATSTNSVSTASAPVSTANTPDIHDNPSEGIFTSLSYDDEGAEADFTNLESTVNISPIPTSRIHTIHPTNQILGDLTSAIQTRSKVSKSSGSYAFVIEPKKISDALEDESWVNSMQEELLQFKIQKDERGVVVQNKARLVAQGHRQEEGIDYDEVFAPVARIEAIRIFLAFASYIGFIVYQMDVKSAFLYRTIDEEVYVSQPPSFIDPLYPKKVYKVVKALYVLHQAPRAWYATLSTFLLKNGYKRGAIDKTLFIKKDKKDIILMSSMGELTFFLGLQVKQQEDGIFISQDKYVAEILKKFDFMNVKTTSTPIETQRPLTKDEEAADVDVHLYRSMIGSLMYLTTSRPDIMFAVCNCSRFQVTPKTSHLNAVKRIFRYLKGKPKLGLWYPRVSPFDLEAYSDSDYAGANLDRKSTTGGCQFLGRRLISWQCKKQTIVATSTTEAEYVAAASCCGQVLWIQNQMLDYGFNFMNTKIHIDNESTICIVKNPVFHSKTKHIEIRHHFIRDAFEKKLIQVLNIHTDNNVADLLTNAFDVSRF